MKALREHPDDLQESSVKTKAFAQHMRIGSEVPLPEIMGDDGDVIMSGRAFFGKEGPSKLGLHAKYREEIRVAKHHANDARVFVRLSDSSCALPKKSDIREIRGALLPILLVARVSFKIGSIRTKIFHFFPDGDKTAGFLIRERLQQDRINQTENGSRRPNSQGQREDSRNGEARSLAKSA
jgi:hypothetical protein